MEQAKEVAVGELHAQVVSRHGGVGQRGRDEAQDADEQEGQAEDQCELRVVIIHLRIRDTSLGRHRVGATGVAFQLSRRPGIGLSLLFAYTDFVTG